MSSRKLLIVAILVVVVLSSIAVFVYNRVNESLEAERTWHANYLVLQVLKDHLDRNPGAWSTSWDLGVSRRLSPPCASDAVRVLLLGELEGELDLAN
jgi:hypothetical protein